MESKEDFIREEIEFQQVILAKLEQNFEEYKENLSDWSISDFDEIFITGSGDSHCASLFAQSIFVEEGLNGRALTPMDLSNFTNFSNIKRPLVIAISVSGKTPRVLEVVRKVKAKTKAEIIGLTDNPNSPLFKEATIPLLINASPPEVLESSNYKDSVAKQYTGYHHDVAQTKSYFANIVAIVMIISVLKKETKDSFLSKIHIPQTWINDIENNIKNITINHPNKTIFISSGMYRSLAQFSQYKWFEFALLALEQDVEEYAHTHYFITEEENTSIVFISPKGPILDRTMELIKGALGKLILPQIIVITDDAHLDLSSFATSKVIYLNDSKLDPIAFYLYSLVALEWLSYYTARKLKRNTNTFRGGVDGEKYVSGSFHTIRKSQIKD